MSTAVTTWDGAAYGGGNGPQQNRALWRALAISCLVHFFLLPFVPQLIVSGRNSAEPQEVPVVYQLDALPRDAQVVDLNDQPAAEKPPRDTPYLSDINRRVAAQQRARNTGPMTPSRTPSRAKPEAKNPVETNPPIEPLAVDRQGPRPYEINTKLPPEWLASLSPSAPSNYLPDIEIGDQTLLNTREYAFAPFFNRMKRQMELVWSPQRVIRRRGLPFREEYRTVLSIVLEPDGTLRSAKVVVGSEVEELDAEALRAVRRAAPYLNPPKELVDPNGTITIPSWHFIVTQRTQLF